MKLFVCWGGEQSADPGCCMKVLSQEKILCVIFTSVWPGGSCYKCNITRDYFFFWCSIIVTQTASVRDSVVGLEIAPGGPSLPLPPSPAQSPAITASHSTAEVSRFWHMWSAVSRGGLGRSSF